jgi:hypothetical protein
MEIITQSIITCPVCGFQKMEVMPEDACKYYFECSNCQTLLKPLSGDCCMFCSFGSVNCPPVQQERQCCSY